MMVRAMDRRDFPLRNRFFMRGILRLPAIPARLRAGGDQTGALRAVRVYIGVSLRQVE